MAMYDSDNPSPFLGPGIPSLGQEVLGETFFTAAPSSNATTFAFSCSFRRKRISLQTIWTSASGSHLVQPVSYPIDPESKFLGNGSTHKKRCITQRLIGLPKNYGTEISPPFSFKQPPSFPIRSCLQHLVASMLPPNPSRGTPCSKSRQK